MRTKKSAFSGFSLLISRHYLKKNGIKNKQKNISSELLESFAQQITGTEDISRNDTLGVPVN